ncbi:hypothetical protein COO60DRAFT_100574 [Scenedesmus sp. NREL 46B-D3]|nr:hypothetical protein COO60DRAFT_100574 [Scenedesmus sp. NREL 46B-D3]
MLWRGSLCVHTHVHVLARDLGSGMGGQVPQVGAAATGALVVCTVAGCRCAARCGGPGVGGCDDVRTDVTTVMYWRSSCLVQRCQQSMPGALAGSYACLAYQTPIGIIDTAAVQ